MAIRPANRAKLVVFWTLIAVFIGAQVYSHAARGSLLPHPELGQTCAIFTIPFLFTNFYVTPLQCHVYWGATAIAMIGLGVLYLLTLPSRSKRD